MKFDHAFLKEEIRCDFLVSEKRKKVWNVELQLLAKFDEVCKKYNLTYFAEYGTLLGAVRHKGFVPWDDDIDINMFRDDYMKLLEIAPYEFTEPYILQNTYNGLIVQAFSKLRDSRTTGIEYTDMDIDFNQGIFIDILPLDDAPDDKNFSQNVLTVQREVWQTVIIADRMRYYIDEGVSFHLDTDTLNDLLNLPVRERFRQFESLNLSHSGTSENVNYIVHEIRNPANFRKKEWYAGVVYLPFEYLTVPVPVGYDQILQYHYGNYHEFVQHGSSHENVFLDPDKPYRYYMEHLEEIQIP